MASNNAEDEKPNLRPTKHTTASGKSLFLHHNPNQPSTKSYIHTTCKNSDEQDPFGIQQPHIEYSLNKQQRWNILNNFHQHTADQSCSSSDNDFHTQSDSEQRRNFIHHRRKYRLYQFHNTQRNANGVGIFTSNTEGQRIHTPMKPYTHGLRDTIKKSEDNDADIEDDVTYYAVVPPPREKQLVNIRKHHNTKSKKAVSSTQRHKFTQIEKGSEVLEQSEDEKENVSTDDDELTPSYYTSSKRNKLQLNDFIPITSTDGKKEISSSTVEKSHLDENNSPKEKHKFYRQISKEEKLYNRDMSTYLRMQQENGESIKPKEKSSHYLMPLSFQPIFLYQPDFTIENLSKIYGKNFIHAQCYPSKYLICLTDRLKSFQWSNKPELFSIYSTLNCYLIIILNDQENICQGQIALNMDLYAETIHIENLSYSNESVYNLNELIEKTIEFITTLSFDIFKPIDSEINQRKFLKNEIDNELSESEFINKQIHQIKLLDKKDLQTKLIIEEISMDENLLIRPEICTSCYSDMTELTPMTALKSCGHWLCNQCWKQYLEHSIKRIKVILCPEWNCCSVVDVGTILSLVNVRCMNIYERNIEKCLVNLSRSYVKCPSKSCSNIVQVIGSGIDHVRCRCGHQFCIDCKQEPHFPATCTSYRAYIAEAQQNGDIISDSNAIIIVYGRNCISCNEFIEKKGGCDHMTCRCGAEFCWSCIAYWKDHFTPDHEFHCPHEAVPVQKKRITKTRNPTRKLYEYALYHRHERAFQNQTKQNENAKRLIGTIPLDKTNLLDTSLIKSQIDKRQALLQHSYEMVKYINYLHRVCEFIAVAADGYANNPIEFSNSFSPLETLILNLSQIFEGGRGYKAIEQLNDLHKKSEKLIERLHQAVIRRRLNSIGYRTS